MHTRKKLSTLSATLLAAALAVGALSGCAPGPEAGSDPIDETPAFESFEEYQLAFAACLREQGIDIADPTSGGQSITQDDGGLAQAIENCQDDLGRPPGQDGEITTDPGTVRDEHLRIAGCLRELGFDVPDPGAGGDLVIPSEVTVEALDSCAPSGVGGSTGGE